MQIELVFLLYVIFNMAVLWFVKNWYEGEGEGEGELDNVITKNEDLDKKLNLQLDELTAEAMNVS